MGVRVAIVFFLIFGVSIVRPVSAESSPARVVLILIDTLRADRLPLYGAIHDTAPYLGKLAQSGVVFERAYSTSSWTAPACASIHTSLHPLRHGMTTGLSLTKKLQKKGVEIELTSLPEGALTIAELFKKAGYQTFGVADNPNISVERGFARGFDRFATRKNLGSLTINTIVREWEKDIQKADKSFLYLHYMEPHAPYDPREPWFTEYKKSAGRKLAAYDSEIRFLDDKIGDLATSLGWDENTLIMVTSDHGEEFLDHGRNGHGKNLYQELIHVPFFVSYPSGILKAKRIKQGVSVLDILPTFAEMLKITLPQKAEGRSLYSALFSGGKGAEPRDLTAHLLKRHADKQDLEMESVISSPWKLIKSNKKPQTELFNLETDFLEQQNLAGTKREELGALKGKLEISWK